MHFVLILLNRDIGRFLLLSQLDKTSSFKTLRLLQGGTFEEGDYISAPGDRKKSYTWVH